MKTQPPLKTQIVYIASFFLAFCSLIYELLLGQAMSISFGSTNQSYIYVIGCYLFGMGIGAWLTRRVDDSETAIQTLIRVEVALIVLFLIGFYFTLLSPGLFDFAHTVSFLGARILTLLFCFGVGIATGCEIPLLLVLLPPQYSPRTLAWDYVGGFLASFLFIFMIPYLGLVRSAHLVPFVNILAVFLLIHNRANISVKTLASLTFSIAFLIVGFVCADSIEVWMRVFLFF